uniref:Putative ovule protein n=1 Tax=Solanum chacoense TaxID=4108 RepID=A0A0V0HP93_SOLCH
MIIVGLHEYIFSFPNLRYFPYSRNFLAYIETQFSTCIIVLRSYSSEEYMSHEFNNFCLLKDRLTMLMPMYATTKWDC